MHVVVYVLECPTRSNQMFFFCEKLIRYIEVICRSSKVAKTGLSFCILIRSFESFLLLRFEKRFQDLEKITNLLVRILMRNRIKCPDGCFSGTESYRFCLG